MKKCKRLTHVVLVAVLLTTALPAVAQADARDDQAVVGLFARVEVFLAKVWEFTTTRPIDLEISQGGYQVERVGAIGKIGPEGSPVGGAAPAGGTNPPPTTHDTGSPQDS